MFIEVFLSLYNTNGNKICLLYIRGGYVCKMSLLYVNPLLIIVWTVLAYMYCIITTCITSCHLTYGSM
jgi:hypothetical protein